MALRRQAIVWTISLAFVAGSAPVRAGQASVVEAQVLRQFATAPRGAADFADSVQLLAVIDRTMPTLTDREAQGRFAWYRLRAMARAARNINYNRNRRPASQSAWIAAHERELIYNSPAGEWMVSPETIRQAHEAFRDTAAADDIAWFLVQNGLAGECEGDVPCYVRRQNLTGGEYLRLHPRGRHATAALSRIATALDGAMDNLEAFPRALAELGPKQRCAELRESVSPLVAAIRGASSPDQRPAQAAVDRYARLCP